MPMVVGRNANANLVDVIEFSTAAGVAPGRARARALGRPRQPTPWYHGAGDAVPVGGGGAEGGEYNGSGMMFDRHNTKYVEAARRAAARVGRAD